MNPALLAGLGIGAAMLLVIAGLFPAPRTTATSLPRRAIARLRVMAGPGGAGSRRQRQLLVGLVLGILAWVISGWVIAVIVLPIAAVVVPPLFVRPQSAVDLAKLTALETWSRGLAGLMSSHNGLEAAIHASVRSAPAAIRPAVSDLSRRLHAQVQLQRAMRAFADDIDDPLGDTIAAAITLGGSLRADRGGGGTSAALDELAHAVAEEVSARSTVESERAGPRGSLRIVTAIAVTAAAIAALTGRLDAYGSPLGQVALLAITGAFLACLVWIRRITAGDPPARLYLPPSANEGGA